MRPRRLSPCDHCQTPRRADGQACPHCARPRRASLTRSSLVAAALLSSCALPGLSFAEDTDADGIPTASDACPTTPEDLDGFQDADGCPDPDNDGDAILDVDDLCPNDPEDLDGFQDADGCPEADNDGDAILDVADQCPDDPEVFNGVQDEDGCPDGAMPIYGIPAIEIREALFFNPGDVDLNDDHALITHELARVMENNPEVLLRVVGHACDPSQGDLQDVAIQRAQATQRALIDEGVDSARVEVEGRACDEPLRDPSSPPEERLLNERVSFEASTK